MWKYLCWPCKIPSFLLRGTPDEVPLNCDGDKKQVKRRSTGKNGNAIPSTTNGTYVVNNERSKTDAVSMQSEVETPPDKDVTPEPKLNANGEIIYKDKETEININDLRKDSRHEKNVPSMIIPSTNKIDVKNDRDSSHTTSSHSHRIIANHDPTDTPVAVGV